MNSMPVTIFIVDDDTSVRTAVSRLVRAAGFEVVACASAEALLEALKPGVRGCIVLDIAMPGLNGLELQETLPARGIGLPVIFLTGRADVHMSVRAMKSGASDFLTKPVRGQALIGAIQSAIERSEQQRQMEKEVNEIRRRIATLTAREYEVMVHVASGRLNKETAADLGTVEKTVKVHRARVMEKMQVLSSAELARLAERAAVPELPNPAATASLGQSPMRAGRNPG